MRKIAYRAGWGLPLAGIAVLVVVAGLGACASETATESTLAFDPPKTHTMVLIDDDTSSSKVSAVVKGTTETKLHARLYDEIIFVNESSVDATVFFDSSKPLFGVDAIELGKGASATLTIQDDAYFGNPGYVHHLKVVDSTQTPGSTIIVCPPSPMPCN